MNTNELKLKIHNENYKKSILFFDEITSTSTYCKDNYKILNDKSIIIAKKQTLGRGKNNRKWLSPSGGLYFSILLKDSLPPINSCQLIPLIVSVAVFEALKNFNVNCKIKWPNDLLINNKKICGILVESKVSSSGLNYLVIGIGLNVNSLSPNDENLNGIFASLKEVYKTTFSLEDLLASIVNNLDNLLPKLDSNLDSVLDTYKSNCLFLNEEVTLVNNNEKIQVKILDIATDGSLKILHNNKIRFINSGEFSIDKKHLK